VLKNKAYLITFILLLAGLLYWIQVFRLADKNWEKVVASDGRGYYAYLPAAFIYNDWEWKFIDKAEKDIWGQEFAAGSWLNDVEGSRVNQYFVGTAIMILPFFLLAMALSPMFGFPVDGYSFLFQHCIVLASVCYFFLGLYWLRKILETYGMSKGSILVTLICIGAGTNLFYYTASEPSMSHVYSFAMISGFCFYTRKLLSEYSRRDLMMLTIIFGLIILIRPVNALIILFIPFLAGSFRTLVPFLKNIFSDKKHFFLCAGVFSGILFIQLFLYFLQSGHFFVYSYSTAKFNFSDPHFWEILFSFRKGFFIYTPIAFLALYGLFMYVPREKYKLFSWLFFFIICTYFLSAWSFWWYGRSFGLRAYIEFLPCFAIPFAAMLNNVSIWKFSFLTTLAGLLLSFNILQSYQYQRGILLGDGMSRETYAAVFMKTDPTWEWRIFNENYQQVLTNGCFHDGTLLYCSSNDLEKILPAWGNTHTRMHFCPAPSGETVSKVNAEQIFSETFEMSLDSLGYDSALVLRASVNVYPSGDPSAVLVISVENGDKSKLWHGQRILSAVKPRPMEWIFITTAIPYPKPEKGDVLKVYVMKEGGGFVYLDNFSVTILKKN